MNYSLIAVGTCCLVWSKARSRTADSVKSICESLKETKRLLEMEEKDLSNTQDLHKQFLKLRKSECIGRLMAEYDRCYQAWGLLENYVRWQRRFLLSRRMSAFKIDNL